MLKSSLLFFPCKSTAKSQKLSVPIVAVALWASHITSPICRLFFFSRMTSLESEKEQVKIDMLEWLESSHVALLLLLCHLRNILLSNF